MDKIAGFFRLFDIAFLAPGTVLFVACHFAGLYPELGADPGELKLTDARGLLFLVLAIGSVYVFGLLVHSLQRVLLQAVEWGGRHLGSEKRRGESVSEGMSWYQHIDQEKRAELALYFWYLRATCWNLAIALPLAWLVTWWNEKPESHSLPWLGLALVATVFLGISGKEYDSALRRAARPTPVGSRQP